MALKHLGEDTYAFVPPEWLPTMVKLVGRKKEITIPETSFDRRELLALGARLAGAGAMTGAVAMLAPRLAFASDTEFFTRELGKDNPRISVDVEPATYWVAFVDAPEIPILGPDQAQVGVFSADAAIPSGGAFFRTYTLKDGVLRPDEAIELRRPLYGSGTAFPAPDGTPNCTARIGDEPAFVLANPRDAPKMRHLHLSYEGGVARHTSG